MTSMIFLLPILLGQTTEEGPLPIELELSSLKVHHLDPLFTRVTVANTRAKSAGVSPDLFRTASFSIGGSMNSGLTGVYRCEYTWASVGYPSGTPGLVSLPQGEKRFADYAILELPRAEEFGDDTWRKIVHGHPTVSVSVFRERSTVPIQDRAELPLVVKSRPDEERTFLTELYEELVRREKAKQFPEGWENLGASPRDFGLESFSAYRDLVQKLVAYEEHLSPGALRDIVHLVRLAQTIYHCPNESEQTKTVEKVLAWLDTLPEVERHCLAMRIVRWASYSPRPDETPYHLLVYRTVQRLPEKAYEFENYRTYELREYASGHPRFRAFLDRQEQSDGQKLRAPR